MGMGYIIGRTLASGKGSASVAAARKAAFIKAHGMTVASSTPLAVKVVGVVKFAGVVGATIAGYIASGLIN